MSFQLGRPLRWAAATALLGALGAFAYSFTFSDRFTSVGALRLSAPNAQAPDAVLQVAAKLAFARPSLLSVVNKRDLYHVPRESQPLEKVLDRMRSDIFLASVPNQPGVFLLGFRYSDPAAAQLATNDLLDLFQRASGTQLSLAQPASVPGPPERPRRWMFALYGLGAGALLGLIAGRLSLLFRPVAN